MKNQVIQLCSTLKENLFLKLMLVCFSFCSYASEIGTPLTKGAKKVVFCGGGELAKEVAIELQRFGVEVVVLDRYANSPAMQVAHRSHVLSMLDEEALRNILVEEKPDLIVPEIESIATNILVELEDQGYRVIPTAKATLLTMNRKAIRALAAQELGLLTSPYRFVKSKEEYYKAIDGLGFPYVIKPIMSSSGKGQTIVKSKEGVDKAWEYAQEGGRAGRGEVIVEGFVDFDYEITLLTVRHNGETSFCTPIGHKQVDGDYRLSWQPQEMSPIAFEKAKSIARKITDALGGSGIFGVEMFVKENEVYFSEASPRPHDTGLVTLISQNLSEFALHARAILDLPIPNIEQYGPSASSALVINGYSENAVFKNLDQALSLPDTGLLLFGKPCVKGQRRMGVGLAKGNTIEEACEKACFVTEAIETEL